MGRAVISGKQAMTLRRVIWSPLMTQMFYMCTNSHNMKNQSNTKKKDSDKDPKSNR